MVRGTYKLLLPTTKMKELGFRYNNEIEDYILRFPVYKYKNTPLLFCEIQIDEDDVVWINVRSSDGSLYAPYYNCQYGKSDVIRIVDTKIVRELKRLGANKMPILIAGQDCERCKFCTLEEPDMKNIKVKCEARNKTYRWGQCIPCEDKKEEK